MWYMILGAALAVLTFALVFVEYRRNALRRAFSERRCREKQEAWAALAARAHPRISKEAQVAAFNRLEANANTGPLATVHMGDVRLARGYHLVMEGYDRFGWPTGHPDSPAAEKST